MSFGLVDVQALTDVAQKVDPNPISFVGRFVGMTPDEQRAGFPSWAFLALGVLGGTAAGWFLHIRFGQAKFLQKNRRSR